MRRARSVVRTLVFLLPAILASGAVASRADAADVTVDAVLVEPASPAPSALCDLKVRLKNAGTQTASYLEFRVTIDGTDVPTYEKHTYVVGVDAGTSGEISLYSFWSPSAAKTFDVRVSLTAAQWVQVKKEGTTTTTSLAGVVAGLPSSGSVTVKMSPAK